MGDVIELSPGGVVDPDEDIDLTITKGDALVLMQHIQIIQADYLPDDDSATLDDFYWQLCDAVWPEDGEE